MGAASYSSAVGFIRRLLRREPAVRVHKIGDDMLVVGDDLFRGMTTPQAPPTQAALDAIVAPATRVELRKVHGSRTVAKTDDAEDLRALRGALRIHDGGIGHCMCLGTLELNFWAHGAELGTVTLHHGVSLRWPPFFENAELADPESLLDWLSAHGVTSEREDYEEARREEAEYAAAKVRWRAAMPAVLEPHRSSMLEPFRPEWPEVAKTLARAYPDPVERARVLFAWLGHGKGPWSGCPSYEEVPEWCLRQLPLDVLVEAAQTNPQEEALREGAARLLAGWEFWSQRGADLDKLPPDLKRSLLSHALESADEDKRKRARAAFE